MLAEYIHYCFSLPSLGLQHNASSPQLASPSGYNTLGRPSSLPVSKAAYHRSSSNPDLAATPTSPEYELAAFSTRQLDRANSMKGDDPHGVKVRGRKPWHEELAMQWVVSSDTTRDVALQHVWFFMELMVKSMFVHLDQTDKLQLPRQMRFPDHFIEDVEVMVRR